MVAPEPIQGSQFSAAVLCMCGHTFRVCDDGKVYRKDSFICSHCFGFVASISAVDQRQRFIRGSNTELRSKASAVDQRQRFIRGSNTELRSKASVLDSCTDYFLHLFCCPVQERRNVHYFFDQDSGNWIRLPISWELNSEIIQKLLDPIQVQTPPQRRAVCAHAQSTRRMFPGQESENRFVHLQQAELCWTPLRFGLGRNHCFVCRCRRLGAPPPR